jgi:hypothetical protein
LSNPNNTESCWPTKNTIATTPSKAPAVDERSWTTIRKAARLRTRRLLHRSVTSFLEIENDFRARLFQGGARRGGAPTSDDDPALGRPGAHARDCLQRLVQPRKHRKLHGDEPAEEHDQALRGRITYSLRVLIEYAKALRLVRESGVIDLKAFPYGM